MSVVAAFVMLGTPAASNAANPCAPKANPCAPKAAAKLSDARAEKIYRSIVKTLTAGYVKSGHPTAKAYIAWTRYNRAPYVSETHGGRLVNNYANGKAKAYGKFEKAGIMPRGSILAKDSFLVNAQGKTVPGPLFVMEKMPAGFDPKGGDWRYAMIMPDGAVYGVSKGKNAKKVEFCGECHGTVADTQDSLFYLPPAYRIKR